MTSSNNSSEFIYCTFPYLDSNQDTLEFGSLTLHHKRCIPAEQGELEDVIDMFRSHTDKPIEAGFYAGLPRPIWKSPTSQTLRTIVSLIRYAVLRPDVISSPEFSYTDFYTVEGFIKRDNTVIHADMRRNFEQQALVAIFTGERKIYPPFQLMNSQSAFRPSQTSYSGLRLPTDIQKELGRLESLLDDEANFEGERDIRNRAILAIRWYNASFKRLPDVSGNSLVCMATAFETLFDTPKEGIKSALAQDIRFLFFGSKSVEEWVRQFYDARSSIVHSGAVTDEDLRVGKSKHFSLVYWARVIFRLCIRTLLAQQEEVLKSHIVEALVPNSKRLRKVRGILSQDLPFEEKLVRTSLAKEIDNLHLTFFDIVDESSYPDLSYIGHTLLAKLVEAIPGEAEYLTIAQRIVDESLDWYKTEDSMERVTSLLCDLDESIIVTSSPSEVRGGEILHIVFQYVRYMRKVLDDPFLV